MKNFIKQNYGDMLELLRALCHIPAIVPSKGLLIVCNSCEEGLGNLLGTKQLMSTYVGRIKQFVTLDSNLHVINDCCVGSHRYHVRVITEGGHSFQEFGKPNAIAILSQIISEIYKIQVPKLDTSRTTYNVGIIKGGTSVNTIAQNAEMLCEYRSDNAEALEIMKNEFESIFDSIKSDGVTINVKRIGDRPCAGELDGVKQSALVECCKRVVEDVINRTVICKSASTDCNIPLSMGIPAVCIGVYEGGGSHTREEWVNKTSLKCGLEIVIKTTERIMDAL